MHSLMNVFPPELFITELDRDPVVSYVLKLLVETFDTYLTYCHILSCCHLSLWQAGTKCTTHLLATGDGQQIGLEM